MTNTTTPKEKAQEIRLRILDKGADIVISGLLEIYVPGEKSFIVIQAESLLTIVRKAYEMTDELQKQAEATPQKATNY